MIYKIGLVGCGRISTNHLNAIKNLSDSFTLVSVCDVIKDRADEKAKEYGCKAYYSFDEMINSEELDYISICTPSGLHVTHGIKAAEKNINVITEKPMAINIKDADRLIKSCDENNVELYVVKQNRLNSTIQMLKKAIDKNRFGKIYMTTVNVFWSRPQSYYDSAKWRGTWELDGGAFLNQASHYVDLMEWLIGPVESVMAHTATLERKIETEDSGTTSIKFRNGALGSMNVTMLTYPKNLEGSITILGENGTVKIGGTALNTVEHWEFADYDDDDKLISSTGYDTASVYGFGHDIYYQNIIKSNQGHDVLKTDGRDGRKSLELIQAIYTSSRDGRKVNLPLEF